jgi:hypothetical protein
MGCGSSPQSWSHDRNVTGRISPSVEAVIEMTGNVAYPRGGPSPFLRT